MGIRIQTGDTEPIVAYVLDQAGNPLVGKTDLYVRVRRDSDGEFLDWNDLTFKAAGWTTLNRILTELDATNAPGLYGASGGLDTGAITNATLDDNYQIIPIQTPGVDAVLPTPGELKVGQWVDDVGTEIDACHITVAYDAITSNIRISCWLDRNGVTITNPTAITVTWHDADSSVLFTLTETDALTSQDPDANGVYVFDQVQLLADDTVYPVDIAVTDSSGTVTTKRGVQTFK